MKKETIEKKEATVNVVNVITVNQVKPRTGEMKQLKFAVSFKNVKDINYFERGIQHYQLGANRASLDTAREKAQKVLDNTESTKAQKAEATARLESIATLEKINENLIKQLAITPAELKLFSSDKFLLLNTTAICKNGTHISTTNIEALKKALTDYVPLAHKGVFDRTRVEGFKQIKKAIDNCAKEFSTTESDKYTNFVFGGNSDMTETLWRMTLKNPAIVKGYFKIDNNIFSGKKSDPLEVMLMQIFVAKLQKGIVEVD